jgi:ribonucleoside-diphosphate reductase alpha chain
MSESCDFGRLFAHNPEVAEQGWLTEAVREAVIRGEPLEEITGLPPRMAELFLTAHQVSPEWHVRIQAAWQKHIDNAVSKTVNLPAEATLDDVDAVFRQAHRDGCKGITVYRDGSRSGQTLSTPGSRSGKPAERKVDERAATTARTPRPRSRVTHGRTFKFRMGCGTLFVTVNRDKHGPCEVFANLGKAGGCPSQSEATCRAVSVALRSDIDPAVLIEQLKGIRCMSTCLARKDNGEISVLSCPDAIAKAIEEAIREDPVKASAVQASSAGRPCPHCGQPMRKESGCSVCDQCQYNSCA